LGHKEGLSGLGEKEEQQQQVCVREKEGRKNYYYYYYHFDCYCYLFTYLFPVSSGPKLGGRATFSFSLSLLSFSPLVRLLGPVAGNAGTNLDCVLHKSDNKRPIFASFFFCARLQTVQIPAHNWPLCLPALSFGQSSKLAP